MGNLIHRGKGSFTHVENTIFFDRTLSAKAKGIYCQIRSLESNPNWKFTVEGFVTLFKDGKDGIESGFKELEGHGFLIRARMRGEDGRYLPADESTWITLDDPAMYNEVAEQLRSEGFTVTSKRTVRITSQSPEISLFGKSEPELPNSSQVESTFGFSTCGESTCGSTTSGSSTCGESPTINPLEDLPSIESNSPSLALPLKPKKRRGKRNEKDVDEFPPEFLELCDLSLKEVSALPFKRDCLTHWKMRVQQGYSPQQIIEAYQAYRDEYLERNGDNMAFVKHLIRWLEEDDGLKAYAGDPVVCRLKAPDGSPLSKEKLAAVHERFGKLYRRAENRRRLILTELKGRDPYVSDATVADAFNEDDKLTEIMVKLDIVYDEYLQTVDPENSHGMRTFAAPPIGSTLMDAVKRKERIRDLARTDPDFAALVERYETMARDTTALRLSGHIDDETWEKRRQDENALLHKIEQKLDTADE